MAKNTVCHIEIDVTDLVRSQAFYESIFDWKFRPFMESMSVFGTGDAHIGGLAKVDAVNAGSSPSVWFEVEDAEETIAAVKKAGGSVLSAPSNVPTVGITALFGDLDGNHIGIVQFVKES